MTTKQITGLKRDTIDKYYTNDDVAERCIEKIIKTVKLTKKSKIIEPSAGGGAFMKPFENKKYNIKGYDIKPGYKNVIKQDFLKLEIEDTEIDYVGNPPFGRQASLAKKFIKKCCKNAKSISFVLPKSFKKESMIRSFNDYFHLEYQEDLGENSFTINEDELIDVPCVFQIWIKKDIKREKVKKYKPVKFKYVKKEETPDFSIRRVGVYAGKIFTEINNKSFQSHNFIKLDEDINLEEFLQEFKKIKFTDNNTVGPKSISKNEFNKEINNIINNIK